MGTLLGVMDERVADLAARWHLDVGAPFERDEFPLAWVAPVIRRDGTRAVLKIGFPHMEAEHESHALRFLDGEPTVRLLECDESLNAMLLERCEPGTSLRDVFQPEQDVIIAGLLKRFWRVVPEPHPFRPLSVMVDFWVKQTEGHESRWHDSALVKAGIDAFRELADTSFASTLLATDLHAGNVLRATREPWLVIDPKPFVGDRAYDATQHLLNCRDRLRTDMTDTIQRVSSMLEVDPYRVSMWLFARLAAEPRDDWDDDATSLAGMVGV